MNHPTHATGRCCRVCHAVVVTATPDAFDRIAVYIDDPRERADRRRNATQAAKVAALVRAWLPGAADWRHDQYDRARTRKGAGLAQLHESTGERDG